MSKVHLKLIIWSLLLAMAIALGWTALSGVASLITYFQTGANPAGALNIVPNVPPDLHVELSWRPDPPDPGRPLDPLTRTEIESAYLRAWLQLHFSMMRGEDFGLATYFSGAALESVQRVCVQPAEAGWRVDQVDTNHELELHFFSADGAIVSFSDHGAWVTHVAQRTGDGATFASDSRADYDVVMLLEDGNWRIRHWLRGAANDVDVPPAASEPTGDFVRRAGSSLMRHEQKVALRGLNYYPSSATWQDPLGGAGDAERDFARARELGVNAVRVFVPFRAFGAGRVEEAKLDEFARLLASARRHDLGVVVALFEFFDAYAVLQWPVADRHLEAILRRFADDSTIVAWDLKNQPDRDYLEHGRGLVNAWLLHIARRARLHDANHLLTIGWSNAREAIQLERVLDIVSFQHDGSADDLAVAHTELRRQTERPLLLSSFGLSTYESALFPGGHTEHEQAVYYANTLRFVQSSDLAGALAWTLHDAPFPSPPGRRLMPWVAGRERSSGILRHDGSAKPAATLLRPGADLDKLPLSAWSFLMRRFWLSWAPAAVFIAVLGYRRLRAARRSRSTTAAPP